MGRGTRLLEAFPAKPALRTDPGTASVRAFFRGDLFQYNHDLSTNRRCRLTGTAAKIRHRPGLLLGFAAWVCCLGSLKVRKRHAMNQYHDLLERILSDGAEKHDRTGTGTLSIFGHQMRFNLAAGFPMLDHQEAAAQMIVYELLWFLKGDTNIGYLGTTAVSIWDEWADANGDLGPVYGSQWRSWPAPDGRKLDQNCQRHRYDPAQSGFATPDRERVESG